MIPIYSTFWASFGIGKLQDNSSELDLQVGHMRYHCTNLGGGVEYHILLSNYFSLLFNYLLLDN